MAMSNKNLTMGLVYLNVALYALCYQMQRPLEPFLVDKLKGEGDAEEMAAEYSKLQSFFSIIQTVCEWSIFDL